MKLQQNKTTVDAIWEANPDVVTVDAVIFIGGYLMCIFLFRLLIPECIKYGTTAAVFLGLVAWTIIFFFVGIFERCLKTVPDNQVWIIADPLTQEQILSGGAINRMRKIRAQRAIQSGPNVTYPWEYLAPGGEITMTKRSLGDEEDRDSFKTSDNNQVLLEYEIFWAVIPGCEINFFRYRLDGGSEDKIAEYLRGLFRAFLQEYCNARTLKELTGSLDHLNDQFVEEFLSGNGLLDMEERMGAQITEGAIFRIAASKELKEIMESQRKSQAIADAAKDLMKRNRGLTWKEALNYANIAAGNQGVDIRSIDENFNVSGLPEGLQIFSKAPTDERSRYRGNDKEKNQQQGQRQRKGNGKKNRNKSGQKEP